MKLTQAMLEYIDKALKEHGQRLTPPIVHELEEQPESMLSRALYLAAQDVEVEHGK